MSAEGPWRTGRKQARNLYRGETYIAVFIGPDGGDTCQLVVEALNQVELVGRQARERREAGQ